MIVIVFDKLMQYQIVDPTDVVSWAFTRTGEKRLSTGQPSIGALEWEIVQGALNKANGRVVIARRKVATLRKEDDEKADSSVRGGVGNSGNGRERATGGSMTGSGATSGYTSSGMMGIPSAVLTIVHRSCIVAST